MDFPRTVHLIGACGAGMRALAEYLIDRGLTLTASDAKTDSRNGHALRNLGVSFPSTEDSLAQAISRAEHVIYSAAIGEHHPERQMAIASGVPCTFLRRDAGSSQSVKANGLRRRNTRENDDCCTDWMDSPAGRTSPQCDLWRRDSRLRTAWLLR